MNEDSDMTTILKKLKSLDSYSKTILHETSKQLAEDAVHDIDLAVAINQTVTNHSVTVHNYKIDIVAADFAGRTKDFYNVIDLTENKPLYTDIALFETAMAIVKKLIVNTISGIDELVQLDLDYSNSLYEVYVHKHNAKTSLNESISLAKMDNAKRRVFEAKRKILKRL
jgi:hypothetical protein